VTDTDDDQSPPPAVADDDEGHPQRWAILAVLNLSLVLIVASVSSLNLAIPSIQRALEATAAELVWINAAYALVFAGILLPAGALGDRFGRKGALQTGLGIFILGALLATLSTDPLQLILLRGVMGIGAALVMPATLSIITVIFPAHERAKAIAIWSGFAGAGSAFGIIASGLLLNHFWWGSVFLVNVPIAATALVLGALLVPTSRDDDERPLDPIGSFFSIGALVALVYGLIEGPEKGWTHGIVIASFVAAVVLAVGWIRIEAGQADPLLDPRIFRIPRFGLGCFTVTTSFTAMFGMFFVLTQYLQFVLGYAPLSAGLRTLPFAMTMVIVAPRGPGIAHRIGRGRTISMGMTLSALGFVGLSLLGRDIPFALLAADLVVIAGGMALVFPAATESIVSSLPRNKAGVASAMNDTTREVGGAIGIALLGSLLSVGYRAGLGGATDGLPPEASDLARDNIGSALAVAASAPGDTGAALADAAKDAFLDGKLLATLVGAAILLMSAAVVFRFFPREAKEPETVAAQQ
jgi:MFS transporter, DHA2 family, integral membrane protein